MRSRLSAAIAGLGLALSGAAVPLLGAQAVPPPDPGDDPCPAAYPVSDLTRDQPVTGKTVSVGTTPDPFTGSVLGVLQDGIAPGIDMILVRLTSSEIDRVGGIWAGMSGSPVYAEDGRLIGAVSYGLAFGPSPVAGVTPAADMQSLLTTPPSSARVATPDSSAVKIPRAAAERIVASGDATATEVDGGLSRLPLPLGVSGLVNGTRLSQVRKLLGLGDGVRLYRAGSVSASSEPTDIVPGGNLAASLSYGDVSAVGVGTTTMVCGSEVVGFGHPFNWNGETSLTLHGADAVYVQEDPTLFPFKLANPTGPVGVIDQDRMAGIKGVLGLLPDTATVTTIVSSSSGATRTGVTEVSLPDFVPDAAAIGLLVNQDRVLDHIGGGSALVHFTISGTTGEGVPFTLVRTNRQSSQWDISYQTIFELGSDAYELWSNDFTDVTFTDIDVTVLLDEAPRSFRVGQVEVLQNGAWTPLTRDSVVKARPATWLQVRTTLTSYRNRYGTKTITQLVRVPRTAPGTRGMLSITGGGGEFFYDEEGFPDEDTSPASFDQLVAQLAGAPRNDELTAQLLLFGERSEITRKTKTNVDDVVQGDKSFRFRVIR